MEPLECHEILFATDGKLIKGNVEDEFFNISIDSRKIEHNDLFIPIVGERFDGHDFINTALTNGAKGCLTQNNIDAHDTYYDDKTVIKVEDTARALRDIATYYRKKFDITIIAVTGSVGKTTTKDMIACVLKQKYNVLKTVGNFNNEIGLPLTILNMEKTHELVVVEMGMSALGEISRLTAIARPDIVVITNIGLSHIEKLGSKNNILKAKMEILEGMEDNGIVILNGDDDLLYSLKGLLKFSTLYYGMEEGMDYQAYNVLTGEAGTIFEIILDNKTYEVEIPLPGAHNVYNALAAICIGMKAGVPINSILKGINQFRPGDMRLNIEQYNGIKVINDAYNASPHSMKAAIEVLKASSGKRKFAVLGDMLELGQWSAKEHKEIGKFAANCELDYIIAVGDYSSLVIEGAIVNAANNSETFALGNNAEVIELLSSIIKPGDVVLVKGSRGMKMEQIVDYIKLNR